MSPEGVSMSNLVCVYACLKVECNGEELPSVIMASSDRQTDSPHLFASHKFYLAVLPADARSSMLRAPLLPSSLADIGSPAKEAFQLALDTSTHGLTLVRCMALLCWAAGVITDTKGQQMSPGRRRGCAFDPHPIDACLGFAFPVL